MTYTANEYLITVGGNLPSAEIWSNTWCVLDVGASNPTSVAVAQVRGFYNDLIASLSDDWSASHCTVEQLSTGLSVPAAWESFSGTQSSQNMPTECAVRISLDDQAGHAGGPFIGGFTVSSLAATGLLATGTQTLLTGALEGLADGLTAEGYQLRINRPSVSQTVVALHGRVGVVWDVIRRRRSAISESYSSVSLA